MGPRGPGLAPGLLLQHMPMAEHGSSSGRLGFDSLQVRPLLACRGVACAETRQPFPVTQCIKRSSANVIGKAAGHTHAEP